MKSYFKDSIDFEPSSISSFHTSLAFSSNDAISINFLFSSGLSIKEPLLQVLRDSLFTEHSKVFSLRERMSSWLTFYGTECFISSIE